MSISSKPTTHAHRFKKFEYKRPRDEDPEDEANIDADSGTSDLEEDGAITPSARGREHYEAVGKSALQRAKDVDTLGPQYAGSRISRKAAFSKQGEEHDPFVDMDIGSTEDEGEESALEAQTQEIEDNSDEFSEVENSENEVDELEEIEEESDDNDDYRNYNDEEDSEASGSDADEVDIGQEMSQKDANIDRDQLRRMIANDGTNVASTIARATQIDIEKGRAVKKQKAVFDSLLNIRIKLQNGIVATNSMSLAVEEQRDAQAVIDGAEKAALNLLNTLETLRRTMSRSEDGKRSKAFDVKLDTASKTIWKHLQESEKNDASYRQKTLQKWSNKTQGMTDLPKMQRLNDSARQTTIIDVVNDQLINMERLLKRTRLPRSCAPLHASQGITESEDIFDDADFYGIMLKELLEQRSIDASNVQTDTISQHWQAARLAKTKKNVDTKASKGRKMRYTVHEKLQNFMAPENRGNWGQRQIDDLFGSLLGKKAILNEAEKEDQEDEMDGVNHEEEALMLFRS